MQSTFTKCRSVLPNRKWLVPQGTLPNQRFQNPSPTIPNSTSFSWKQEKGPQQINDLILNGPNYDRVDVYMNMETDFFTNEFFTCILNLRPRILTIFNNAKGLSEDFNTDSITKHINFPHLDQINFDHCYDLKSLLSHSPIGHKVHTLVYGPVNPSRIELAIPSVIRDFTNLKEFSLYGLLLDKNRSAIQHLKTLLDNKPNLTSLNLSIISLTLCELVSILPDTNKLLDFYVEEIYEVDDVSIPKLFDYLKTQTSIEHFGICCNIDDDKSTNFVQTYVDFYHHIHTLKSTNIMFLSMSNDQWSTLSSGLSTQPLESLNIDSTNLSDDNVEYFSPCFSSLSHLRSLTLEADLTSKGLTSLLNTLNSQQLQKLYIRPKRDNSDSLQPLCDLVRNHLSLTNISLDRPNLSDDDVFALVLSCQPTLHTTYFTCSCDRGYVNPTRDLSLKLLEYMKNTVIPHSLHIDISYTGLAPSHDPSQNYILLSNTSGTYIRLCYNYDKPFTIINTDDPNSIIPSWQTEPSPKNSWWFW